MYTAVATIAFRTDASRTCSRDAIYVPAIAVSVVPTPIAHRMLFFVSHGKPKILYSPFVALCALSPYSRCGERSRVRGGAAHCFTVARAKQLVCR